jgi:hypothetical protein
MLLVEKPVADTHCSRLYTKRSETKRAVETPGAVVFRIHAKLDLKYSFVSRKGQHVRV